MEDITGVSKAVGWGVRVPHPALVLTVARERATVGTNKRKTELNSGKRSLFPCFRRVAQFGSALRSGRRGRRFKSCYADRGAETTRGCSRLRVLSRRGVWRHWWCAGCVRVALGCLRQGALGVGE